MDCPQTCVHQITHLPARYPRRERETTPNTQRWNSEISNKAPKTTQIYTQRHRTWENLKAKELVNNMASLNLKKKRNPLI